MNSKMRIPLFSSSSSFSFFWTSAPLKQNEKSESSIPHSDAYTCPADTINARPVIDIINIKGDQASGIADRNESTM
jgi:hypothetical protein